MQTPPHAVPKPLGDRSHSTGGREGAQVPSPPSWEHGEQLKGSIAAPSRVPQGGQGHGMAAWQLPALPTPTQRDRAKHRDPFLWALARSFLGGGRLHSRECLGNSLSLWGRLSHHRGAPMGRRAPSVLPRSPSPPRPCAARTAQTLVAPSGLRSPQAVPGPSLSRALHRHDGATCSPSPQPGGGPSLCQPRSAAP